MRQAGYPQHSRKVKMEDSRKRARHVENPANHLEEADEIIDQREAAVLANYKSRMTRFREVSESSETRDIFQNWAAEEANFLHNIFEIATLEEVYSIMKGTARKRAELRVEIAQQKFEAEMMRWKQGRWACVPEKTPIMWTNDEFAVRVAEVERLSGKERADKFRIAKMEQRNRLLNWEFSEEDIEQLGMQLACYGIKHMFWPDGVSVQLNARLAKNVLTIANLSIPCISCSIHQGRVSISSVPIPAFAIHSVRQSASEAIWNKLESREMSIIPGDWLPTGFAHARQITKLISQAVREPRHFMMDIFEEACLDRSYIPPANLPMEPIDDPSLRHIMAQVSPLIADPDAHGYLRRNIWEKVADFTERLRKIDEERQMFTTLYTQLQLTRQYRLQGKTYVPKLDTSHNE